MKSAVDISCVYHSNFVALQSKTTQNAQTCMGSELCISLKFCSFAI